MTTCCCRNGPAKTPPPGKPSWQTGDVQTPVGPVPQVGTTLSGRDRWGAVAVRWNLGRMDYRVTPGLYAIGSPKAESPVLVTANYKLTFDRLRQELGGLDAWLLILDTDGINVWCAAGKGTFGTAEVVARVEAAKLAQVVSHRTLILPQLGAPGVAAHSVQKQCGFRVVYGPVRAADLPAFLAAGMQATPEMRRVRFGLGDRLAVVPVELTLWAPFGLLLAVLLGLAGGFTLDGYSWGAVLRTGLHALGLIAAAFVAGLGLVPALLPWLPGRAFASKGNLTGLIAYVLLASRHLLTQRPGTAGMCELLAWLFLLPSTSSFVAMNYTGTSTFTSMAGVKQEMKVAVPLQALGLAFGFGLFLAARLVT